MGLIIDIVNLYFLRIISVFNKLVSLLISGFDLMKSILIGVIILYDFFIGVGIWMV